MRLKSNHFLAVIFCFALFLQGTTAVCEERLTLGSLDWEPYIGKILPGQGWVAQVVREAFSRSGITVDISFRPWARVVQEAKSGKTHGYFPEYYSENLTEHFIFSHPFPGGPLGFFKHRDRVIEFKTLNDLKNYKIGVVRGYVNTVEFDSADFLNKEPAKDDLSNLNMLVSGRVDLCLADKFVGEYLLGKHLKDKQGMLEFMDTPLEIKQLYVCLSKKTRHHDLIMDRFNESLEAMMADGTFERILNTHDY